MRWRFEQLRDGMMDGAWGEEMRWRIVLLFTMEWTKRRSVVSLYDGMDGEKIGFRKWQNWPSKQCLSEGYLCIFAPARKSGRFDPLSTRSAPRFSRPQNRFSPIVLSSGIVTRQPISGRSALRFFMRLRLNSVTSELMYTEIICNHF